MWRLLFRKLNINSEITGHNLSIVLFNKKMYFFFYFHGPTRKICFPKTYTSSITFSIIIHQNKAIKFLPQTQFVYYNLTDVTAALTKIYFWLHDIFIYFWLWDKIYWFIEPKLLDVAKFNVGIPGFKF